MANSATLVMSVQPSDGRALLGVVAKRSYRIDGGSRPVAHGEPRMYTEPLYREAAEGTDFELLHDTDVASLLKPSTDVVLLGSAHSHKGRVRELVAVLSVGNVRKTVRVVGDRLVEARGDALSASLPKPFASMPLSWSRAYGGRDRGAEPLIFGDVERLLASRSFTDEDVGRLGAASYPRNRIGRGFWIDVDRGRLHGAPLPNLDDPADPVQVDRLLAAHPLDWMDRPVPAGFGRVDAMTFPRGWHSVFRALASAPKRPVREVEIGALRAGDLAAGAAESEDPRFFSSAAPGLAAPRMAGNELVRLWNLHRRHEELSFALPGDRPRLVLEPPGCRAVEVEPVLTDVLLEPDDDRLTLTWAGALQVAAVFPDDMCKAVRHAAIWSLR